MRTPGPRRRTLGSGSPSFWGMKRPLATGPGLTPASFPPAPRSPRPGPPVPAAPQQTVPGTLHRQARPRANPWQEARAPRFGTSRQVECICRSDPSKAFPQKGFLDSASPGGASPEQFPWVRIPGGCSQGGIPRTAFPRGPPKVLPRGAFFRIVSRGGHTPHQR